jgi:hypothetical protein
LRENWSNYAAWNELVKWFANWTNRYE